jgi:hypothetical protein
MPFLDTHGDVSTFYQDLLRLFPPEKLSTSCRQKWKTTCTYGTPFVVVSQSSNSYVYRCNYCSTNSKSFTVTGINRLKDHAAGGRHVQVVKQTNHTSYSITKFFVPMNHSQAMVDTPVSITKKNKTYSEF